MSASPVLGLYACTPTSSFFPGDLGIELGSSHVLHAECPFGPGFLSFSSEVLRVSPGEEF